MVARKSAAKSARPQQAAPAKKAAAGKQGSGTARSRTGRGHTAMTANETAPPAREPAGLPVRPGEEPWTAAEAGEARAQLDDDAARLREEIRLSEAAVSGLMRDSGDGAGDDQADVGTKNISREHEMSLADNAREMLIQTEHALERLDNGTYGRCESCGNPIGKARVLAFPRATLCVECKQRTERR
ncbi:TraR/DksA family transcriptional regulator [Streptantibioticus silvisoli]|nr:TraR/DksA family transcriptional regulator [Streptantibioticus silvisoli]